MLLDATGSADRVLVMGFATDNFGWLDLDRKEFEITATEVRWRLLENEQRVRVRAAAGASRSQSPSASTRLCFFLVCQKLQGKLVNGIPPNRAAAATSSLVASTPLDGRSATRCTNDITSGSTSSIVTRAHAASSGPASAVASAANADSSTQRNCNKCRVRIHSNSHNASAASAPLASGRYAAVSLHEDAPRGRPARCQTL